MHRIQSWSIVIVVFLKYVYLALVFSASLIDQWVKWTVIALLTKKVLQCNMQRILNVLMAYYIRSLNHIDTYEYHSLTSFEIKDCQLISWRWLLTWFHAVDKLTLRRRFIMHLSHNKCNSLNAKVKMQSSPHSCAHMPIS